MAPNLVTMTKLSPFIKKKQVLIHYRIVVLGPGGSGKTSLIRRLACEEYFETKHVPTIEQLYHMEYKMNNSDATLLLDFLDTSGTYPFPAMQDLAIQNADAIFLVYQADQENSFEEVARLKEKIFQIRKPKMIPIVVIGNKLDLGVTPENQQLLDSVVGIDWEFGHVFCSAKSNHNLPRIFTQLLKQMMLVEKRQRALEICQLDSEGSENESDSGSPIRPSLATSDIFFPEDFEGSQTSLNLETRKTSLTDSELEIKIRNEFRNTNCIIH